MDVQVSLPVQAITCLSINSAMSYGFQLILGAEGSQGKKNLSMYTESLFGNNNLEAYL